MAYYQKHLYFCINHRENGKKCCQEWVRNQGLGGAGGVRVSSSGCMGRCSEGPILVVYPEGVWYTYASFEDIDEILNQHIKDDKKVERLLI